MSLAVVIVTRNSAESLPACLRGLGPDVRARTLVVDNGSSDGSPDVARAFGVRVLRDRENPGFGRAATRGARATDARVLCFLNPDCEPEPGLFDAGVAALRGRPRDIACPEIVEDGRALPGRQPGYTRTKLLADLLETRRSRRARRAARWLRRLPFHDDPRWAWPHGACFFIGRAFFEELGGFDASYFLYMEDVDLGRRAAAAGGHAVSLPCRVRHRAHSGARLAPEERARLLDAGRLHYARRTWGPSTAWLLRTAVAPFAPGPRGRAS